MNEPGLFRLSARMGRLIRKELSTILRDRRTIITLLLMPLLLYPLLTIAFWQFFQSTARDKKTETLYRIGVRSDREARDFFEQLAKGLLHLKEQEAESSTATPPRLHPVPVPNMRQSLRDGLIDVGVHIRRAPGRPSLRAGPAEEDNPLRKEPDSKQTKIFICDLYYLEDSSYSRSAKEFVERLLAAANNPWLFQRSPAGDARAAYTPFDLAVAGLAGTALAVSGSDRFDILEPRPIAIKQEDEKAFIPLYALIPLILILMTMTGAVYPAIDLTAGERERGTLEVLVAAPIPRLSLLFSKYVAVVTVAVMTAAVNLVTMTVTLQLSGLGAHVFEGGLPPVVVVRVFFLMLLFAAFFSAVLLSVTSFARSFKEGQAYLVPLMLVSMAPGMVSLLDVKLDGTLQVVPLLNIVLLTRDMLQDNANLATSLVVIISTAVYAAAAVALAARIFGAEAVLYSEQATWGDLFRRPKQAQPALTLPAALFCIALMFPVSFVVLSLLTRVDRSDFTLDLVLNLVGNLVLFGLIPCFYAWMGRVRFKEGFRLERLGLWGWPGAVLLGLSLWAMVYLIHLQLRSLGGGSSFGARQVNATRQIVLLWREHSPVPIIVSRAIVPAVLEELFFRGLLLAALLRVLKPGKAILTSALFFGAFHLIEGMSPERVLTTTLLGLVLGWLAWWTGSVIPGMIAHALHNSLLLLLLYYQRKLVEAGWVERGTVIPMYWLQIAAGLFFLGFILLWVLGRNRLDARKATG